MLLMATRVQSLPCSHRSEQRKGRDGLFLVGADPSEGRGGHLLSADLIGGHCGHFLGTDEGSSMVSSGLEER